MILSIKDTLLLIVLLTSMVFGIVRLIGHARYADSLFGNLTQETLNN